MPFKMRWTILAVSYLIVLGFVFTVAPGKLTLGILIGHLAATMCYELGLLVPLEYRMRKDEDADP